eukprot:8530280-Karenia_brevis.AAC.1
MEDNQDEVCGAKLLLRIKREFALWDFPWKPSVTFGLRFTFEGSSRRTLLEVEELGNVWLFVHKFGQNKCWMARAYETESATEKCIVLQKPLVFRPILHVLSTIHEVLLSEADGSCTEDLVVDRLELHWGLHS